MRRLAPHLALYLIALALSVVRCGGDGAAPNGARSCDSAPKAGQDSRRRKRAAGRHQRWWLSGPVLNTTSATSGTWTEVIFRTGRGAK